MNTFSPKKLTPASILLDADVVSPHNLANQIFRQQDIGRPKVEALYDILFELNPEVKDGIKLCPDGWNGQRLSGYVFLCVDNIELRRQIVEKHFNNPYIKEDFLNSMNFSHDEAKSETPVSACGVTLGVAPTVRAICALGVANFVNYIKGNGLKKLIILDVFNFDLLAF